MTHTPGPWRVWEAGKESWEICEPSNPNRHSHFANVKVGNMWGEEGKANARLIASAPDLLSALKDAIEFANAANNQIAGQDLPASVEWLAIVAKAEGRT